MSALGQKRTCAGQQVMSALPPKADMCSAVANVRFGPKADITAPCLPRTRRQYREREGLHSGRSLKGGHSICRRALVKQKWRLLFHQIALALIKLAASRNHDDLERSLAVPRFHAIRDSAKGRNTTNGRIFCRPNAIELHTSPH